MSIEIKPIPACPDCGGRYLDGWRWQHRPKACSIRAAEDATQAADAERGRAVGGSFARPTTPTEERLWELATGGALRPRERTTVVHPDFIPGYWTRSINNHATAMTAA